MLRRSLPVLLSLAALLAACGGDDGRELIALKLRTGQLEQAAELLADKGPEFDRYRRELAGLRQQRADLDAGIEAFRASRGHEPLAELVARLEVLGEDLTDPIARETLAAEKSSIADWIAEGRPGIGARPVALAPALEDDGPGEAWDAGSRWTGPNGTYRPGVGRALASGARTGTFHEPLAPGATVGSDPAAEVGDDSHVLLSSDGGQLAQGNWPEDPVERGEAAEAEGEWMVAAYAWVEAAEDRFGAERRALFARAMAADCRAAFWSLVDPEGDGLVTADGLMPITAVSGAVVRQAAKGRDLAPPHQLGLALELWARGVVDGEGGGPARVQALIDDGAYAEAELHDVVALVRGEALPEGGYRWHEGAFVGAPDYLEDVVRPRLKRLTRRLQVTRDEKREAEYETFAALVEEFPVLESDFAAALEAGRAKAAETLSRSSNMKQLAEMHELSLELDDLRAEALDLIFDTEKYFYPIPADRQSEYDKVQREVDARVAAVRELWDDPMTVSISNAFQDDLADLTWFHEKMGGEGAPDEVPGWVFGLIPTLDEYTVRTFTRTPDEAAALVRDHRIWAANEAMWEGLKEPPLGAAMDQVRITNRYRMLLGRRCLAWHPKIQEAAQIHSDYMSRTGDFSHFEQGDPERYGPFDRMQLVGYASGVSENIHGGSGGPRGAHRGWTHSAGHHRNLLMESHREMATAVAARYWTQNFGVGTDFQDVLPEPSPQPWRN